MCTDYLSQFTQNNKHENTTTKFSNKFPKLKEESLHNNNNIIPDTYKIQDRPITYKDRTEIFKKKTSQQRRRPTKLHNVQRENAKQ